MTVTTLRFNQVTPGLDRKDVSARYRATVEMAAFGDAQGFDLITLEEHHGVVDGWSPAPIATAAAIFGATSRIPVMLCALITPLYDPLRLAEEISVLDHLSDGRVTVVAGIGYRPAEYELMGVEWKERGRIQDEVLETLLAAWTGEEFEYRGRRVTLTPPPLTRPHPPLIVGGSSKAAVRRAVRLRLPLFTAAHLPELVEYYDRLAAEAGWDGGFVLLPPDPTRMVFCTEDPEHAWAHFGERFLHEARTYASWQTPDIRSAVSTKALTVDQLRAEGTYCCLTPEQCVELACAEGPLGNLLLHPMCGGIPVDAAWESLHLFADKVMPALREL
ncbi:alkanesulfonate monooxygenase SsuD/methylene tetrahydromethanopterin reductase-like flavin-dependent oxidoreductase (luciferase family) [Streptacidiphilus sp. MAP12-20]|uniref:LLM class flavin-dependent oxidoreductase n=1 Tax=Streptacidiphilus sp. MAP12-20 TaxID=3156299 RepID=UPI003511432B